MSEEADKKLKPGKLIQWSDGKMGLLVRRFDYYVERGISSRNYRPQWHWTIDWIGSAPLDYIFEYGVPEDFIHKFVEIIE